LPGPAIVLMNSIPIVRERVLHIVVVEIAFAGRGLAALAFLAVAALRRAGGRRRRRRRLRQHGGAGNRRRAGRRHDRLAGGLAVVQDAMTMLEIPSDESGGAPGRLLHARGT